MTVPLTDGKRLITPLHECSRDDLTRAGTKTQGPSLIDILTLAGHEIDHLIPALLIELARIGIRDPRHVSGIFNDRNLHAETDAEIGYALFPRKLCREDHAFDPAASESARNDDAVQPGERLLNAFLPDSLRIDPVDIDMDIVIIARMVQGLSHRQVSVVKPHILPDKPDLHAV